MSETELRHLQLAEVRAMLNLPKDSTHELVIHYLLRHTGNTKAVPERYRNTFWFNQGVWFTPEEKERSIKLTPIVRESDLWMKQAKHLFLAFVIVSIITLFAWGMFR